MHDRIVHAHTARTTVAEHAVDGPPADAEDVQRQRRRWTTAITHAIDRLMMRRENGDEVVDEDGCVVLRTMK